MGIQSQFSSSVANALFAKLERAKNPYDILGKVKDVVEEIRNHLSAAGTNLTALDPTSNSTEEEIEIRIKEASLRINKLRARAILTGLEETSETRTQGLIKRAVQEMRYYLSEAGVDVTALDETGNATAEDMEVRIQKAVSKANIVYARLCLKSIATTYSGDSSTSIKESEQSMRGYLSEAGADASALDPTGESTTEEMEERIKRTIERARKLCEPEPPLIGNIVSLSNGPA